MRPLFCQIRLNHLRDNYQYLKRQHGGRLLAVVKANAYGHGALRCAQALADLADGFAVAFLDEALQLRSHGIKQPIVLLEGAFGADEYALIEQHDLWAVIHQPAQLEWFLAHSWRKATTVWLKMDSGMHRVGFDPLQFASAHAVLQQHDFVEKIVNMSHFACADEVESDFTATQLATFDEFCAKLVGESSLANSAGILFHAPAHRDWGRAGLALYGVSPLGQVNALKPVMRLVSRVFAQRELPAHEPIGYGATFCTDRTMRVGVVACGYADGYPRAVQNGAPVAIDGKKSRLIGRVSMDMLTVDLADGQIGSEVELFGDVVNINEVAQSAQTIAYEILCHIKRATRVYLD